MKALLIIATLVEIALLVGVLAVYLIGIARQLRTIARTLGLVTFGVRAIEKQTEPLGSSLRDINAALQRVAGLLGGLTEPGEAEQKTPVHARRRGGGSE